MLERNPESVDEIDIVRGECAGSMQVFEGIGMVSTSLLSGWEPLVFVDFRMSVDLSGKGRLMDMF
ncbi:MAG: hypothetical protein KKB70_03445, partial [Proteobacteria bacterium]|nr:hypothetical protein [Pseudomonadota bacterium]MBU1611942.1 hypothetical protein [Pseudomonadota bacterium]